MRNLFSSALAALASLSLLFSPFNGANAQATPVDSQTAAALQAKLDSMLNTYNLQGLSATVIIPEGTWNGVSGISHANVPIDTAMVFGYGSTSKIFTAVAILLLQEDGLLSISDSLHEFLPAYANINPNITIRQLLQNTSGLYPYTAHPGWQNAVNNNPSQAMTPQFVLTNYINPPFSPPGVTWQFSTTNYLLLGLIIEQVTGQSYASFIRQALLDPLQLTSMYVREHEPATGVMPHNWYVAGPSGPGVDMYNVPMTADLGTSASDAAMAGNAYDLARWGQLLFTGQVLQNLSLLMMTQFHPLNVGILTGYGLGLMRSGAGATEVWGHGGNILGFSSSLIFSPADSIVVSVLSNKTSSGFPIGLPLLEVARQQLVTAAPGDVAGVHNALACYPNPTRGKGTIRYSLQKAQPVEITLQNCLGQTVQTLLSQPREAGEHSLTFDTSTLASGMYFCTLHTATGRLVQRWVVTD